MTRNTARFITTSEIKDGEATDIPYFCPQSPNTCLAVATFPDAFRADGRSLRSGVDLPGWGTAFCVPRDQVCRLWNFVSPRSFPVTYRAEQCEEHFDLDSSSLQCSKGDA